MLVLSLPSHILLSLAKKSGAGFPMERFKKQGGREPEYLRHGGFAETFEIRVHRDSQITEPMSGASAAVRSGRTFYYQPTRDASGNGYLEPVGIAIDDQNNLFNNAV